MKVTNSHHFCKGVTLEIDGEKLRWTVDKDNQRFKYGTIRVQNGEAVMTMNPLASNEEFVSLLGLVFEFTGVNPNSLKIELSPISTKNDETDLLILQRQEVIDRIYAQSLERKVRLVRLEEECDCEVVLHGYECPGPLKVTKLELMPLATTYGDLLKVLGDEYVEGGVKHYEYPDSVWLYLKELPKAHDAMIATKQEHDFDPGTLYLRFYYDR